MNFKSLKNIISRCRVWLAVVVLLFSVLQNGLGTFPKIFGARALLLIPLVTAIAMYERDIAGMLYGLFAGALWDIFASGNNFNAIYLLVVGFVCGSLINTIMRNNIVTHFMLSAIATLLYSLGYWGYHFIFGGLDKTILILFKFYLPSTIYTILLTPLIFLIVRAIEQKYKVDAFAQL